MRYFLLGLLFVNGAAIAAEKAPPPPKKPIDCFAPNLTATEGIECLQRMSERAHFEATLKALQR